MASLCFFRLIFMLLYIASVWSYDPIFDLADIEFSTIIKAGKKLCFFQYAKEKQTLRFEYRVTDAGFTKLDITQDLKITFYVRNPKMKMVFREKKKSKGIIKYNVVETGDHEICLDNTFSSLSSKTVYFEVSVDVKSEGYKLHLINSAMEADKKKNDTYTRLQRTANKVKSDLSNIKHYQDTFKAVEARDINIQERNLTKINAFSSLTTVFIMLFVSFQLFVLKSMFVPSSILYKIFKFLCL